MATAAPVPAIQITDVRVSLCDEDKLMAFVTIVLDNSFEIRGLKVILGNNGLFVAMPCRRRGDGSFQDLAHPIQHDFRDYLEETVLKAYFNAKDDGLAGIYAKLDPPPPNLFGAARLKLGSEEEA
jgi:stage V sporulation protein G